MREGRKAFRSLAWAYHEPGGIVLWWLIRADRRLHILDELPFDQKDEKALAESIKAKDAELGIGYDTKGDLRKLQIAAIGYTVGTPEIVSKPGPKPFGWKGETIGDRLITHGILVTPADDDRLNGWQRCQTLLQTYVDGEPWLTIDPRCTQLIQAIPTGLRDDKHTDDVQNPAPALTAFRYGAMSRPSPSVKPLVVKIPAGSPADIMRKIRDGKSANRQFGQAR